MGTLSTTLRFDFASEELAKVFAEKITHALECAVFRDGHQVHSIVEAAQIEPVTKLAERLGGVLRA